MMAQAVFASSLDRMLLFQDIYFSITSAEVH